MDQVAHLHADGYMTKQLGESKFDQLDIGAIRDRCQALDSKGLLSRNFVPCDRRAEYYSFQSSTRR